MSLYYPMRARFSAVVVSKGAVSGGWPASVRKPGLRDIRAILRPIRAAGGLTLEIRWEAAPSGMRIPDIHGRPVFRMPAGVCRGFRLVPLT